ncbi:hypothetical protein LCGC14_2760250 [marine sediment metagenome]|uniref:Uncharacterized protein n=1 Tax=marine sediment metagenome TaxID=412755 RepID=A0A0F9B7Q4_9ZZZZ
MGTFIALLMIWGTLVGLGVIALLHCAGMSAITKNLAGIHLALIQLQKKP